ncbi:carboxymuconolactone decarboxylase family protein [Actinotalea fermentans]|nr:carboxymuconolactone decarboxylase family protein [Actinotalea fermentans]KGM16539.1 hypothetical protein N867_18985 [Actinotalea fermentans ATCC 43279 = JCM 9966 = DSM 3133]
MAWISGPDEAEPDVQALFEADREALGFVREYTRVFAHRPAVYAAWAQLNGAVKASMDLRTYELATVAAARRLRSSYCCLAHGQVMLRRGMLDADGLRCAVADEPTDQLSERDRAVMALADAVAAGAADMTDEHLAPLRALGVPDDEILSVVLAAAARCFFSTVLDAVGAQPDRDFLELPDAVRRALVVGRPIAGEVAPPA